MAKIEIREYMELKYQDEIDEDCDRRNFTEKEVKGYRWVFNDINNSKNFKPPIKRTNHPNNKCSVWALSFFDTAKNANKRMKELCKHKKNLYKRIGTHVAVGDLNEKDGIANEPNDSGHFSLFEYEGVELKNKFTIIGVSI